jgi:hypothetical protein
MICVTCRVTFDSYLASQHCAIAIIRPQVHAEGKTEQILDEVDMTIVICYCCCSYVICCLFELDSQSWFSSFS